MLTPSEYRRYSRHLALDEVGEAGQLRLKRARVLIVGAGGLGSPAALYLAAAGVGALGLVDFDEVELANLQRQIIHGTSTVGQPKVASATARIADLNPEVAVECFGDRLTSANALDRLARYDVVLDGSDNFPTRYLINDAAVLTRRPFVSGSIARFEGQVSVFGMPGGPCYRCLFPTPPAPGSVPSCADAGVLGVLPGVIGTLQAVEALKLLLGIGHPLVGRLLCYDALAGGFREWAIHRDRACPVCGDRPSIHGLVDYDSWCGLPGEGEGADATGELSPREIHRLLREPEPPQVVDVREGWEWNLGRLPASVHIPLDQLAARLGELDRGRPVVALCHKGARSRLARAVLGSAGFRVWSLRGGIDAWAVEVDAAVPRY
ncbi:MAG: molybdopterin-synthase adenylyltransferase MoeB [Gemmatimonadales bacterium]